MGLALIVASVLVLTSLATEIGPPGSILQPAVAHAAAGPAAPRLGSVPVFLYVDGAWVRFPTPPALDRGVVVAPLRALVEAMAAQVTYDPALRQAVVQRGPSTLLLGLGQTTATIDGRPFELCGTVRLAGDYLVAPVRPVVEAFGGAVMWDAETRTLYAVTPEGRERGVEVSRALDLPGGATRDELSLLARVVFAEAGDEPYEGLVAVAAVVLNRTRSGRFPADITSVIYQKNQFGGTKAGRFNMQPSTWALRAAMDALNGWDPTGGALFFYNPERSTTRFFSSRMLLVIIGHHWFYR